MEDPPMETFLTPNDLSRMLRVSRVYIYKLVRERRIPFFHVDRLVRSSPAEITQWLEKKRNQPWERDRNRKRPLDA
jgi:excisionase family DNA binding protein